uniref:Uncharacterized protein n=1 Tax=Caenorhabditis tropicalis TaxID=1561998 RepID=A0A1I7T9S9_9PELO
MIRSGNSIRKQLYLVSGLCCNKDNQPSNHPRMNIESPVMRKYDASTGEEEETSDLEQSKDDSVIPDTSKNPNCLNNASETKRACKKVSTCDKI